MTKPLQLTNYAIHIVEQLTFADVQPSALQAIKRAVRDSKLVDEAHYSQVRDAVRREALYMLGESIFNHPACERPSITLSAVVAIYIGDQVGAYGPLYVMPGWAAAHLEQVNINTTQFDPILTTDKEITMSLINPNAGVGPVSNQVAKAVEKKVFIFGTPAELVTDEKIYEHIQRLEREISGLNAVGNKPKKLKEKIAGLEADIKSLVDFVDNRDAEETAETDK